MKSQTSIRARILWAVAVLLLLAISIAAVGTLEKAALERKITELTGIQRERDDLVEEWQNATRANTERWQLIAATGSQANYQYLKPMIERTSARVLEVQKRLREIETDPRARTAVEDVAAKRASWVQERDKVAKAIEAGDSAAALRLGESTLADTSRLYKDAASRLSEVEKKHTQELVADARADIKRSGYIYSALLMLSVVVGGLTAWLLTRTVIRPIEGTASTLREIAGGNLAASVPHAAPREFVPMLRDLTTMRDNLHSLVTSLASTSDSIRTASTEVAVGNQDLSGRTEEAASSLQETAAAMAQISQTVVQNADAARTAAQLAASASSDASRGGDVVSRVIQTMHEISAASHKISEIIGVIDGIAFQTNILALNASVEAARAGEQGRGFAVVAGEVRNLAQRSAEAAKEIKTLIGGSAEKVEFGSQLVTDAGAVMNEIVASTQRVTDMISEITAATTEQASGITQVNQAVGTLDQMTQQNAALVEQSAAAAESLKAQAQQLGQVVSGFRLQVA